MEIAAPLARVVLRYFGAALLTKAGLSLDLSDPDVQSVTELSIGFALSAVSEIWWWLSRRYGWRS